MGQIREGLKTNFANGKLLTVNLEYYNDSSSMVNDCKERRITSSKFYDMPNRSLEHWHGVKTYDEALELLDKGYESVMSEIKAATNRSYTQNTGKKRYRTFNSVCGFQPIVPNVLLGIPNNMINSELTPIKIKVIDIYYDMTCSCNTKPEEIVHNGKELLKCILGLEMQGYKLNLYVCNSYSDHKGNDYDCDMLCVKVKDSSKPLDLKRISYPLTHPSFFRVLGFDWYSKFPVGKYRPSYGRALGYSFSTSEIALMAKGIFGKNAVYINATDILNENSEAIKNTLMNRLSA